MTSMSMTSYAETHDGFLPDASFAVLAGDAQQGFNACVELCDRWTGKDRPALRWLSKGQQEQVLSFEDLAARASRFAHALTAMGISAGDRVAGLLPRTPDLLTVFLGTLRIGAVYQPVFTAFGPKAIETRLLGSGARLVVTDRANRSKLEEMGPARIPSTRILVTDEPDGAESMPRAMEGQPEHFAPVMRSADDPFLMMFTSGTTGSPKGVLVPIHMLRSIWAYMRYSIALRDDDHYWNVADPGWAYGLYYGLTGPLMLGQTATMSEAAFTVEMAYDVIRRFGITNLAGAPTAYRAMAASPLPVPAGVRAISSAGEPLDPETASWLERHFGCRAADHYGQTECGMIICDHNGLDHPRRPGFIGYTMPGFRVVTLTNDGRECAAGELGMVAVDRKSPLFWFKGYDQRDQQPFLADYYLTGDSAVREADGSFRFVGREDDVITSSGYRIGPFEVESALMEHPAVVDAAVIGKPCPVRTEIVKAYVVLGAGHQTSPALAEQIGQFVKKRLAAHSYPREIDFVDALPKTPSGKVQRYVLRQREVDLAREQQAAQ